MKRSQGVQRKRRQRQQHNKKTIIKPSKQKGQKSTVTGKKVRIRKESR